MLVETQLFFSSWPYVLERTSNKAIPKNSMVWGKNNFSLHQISKRHIFAVKTS
jgi:hypothetical protein